MKKFMVVLVILVSLAAAGLVSWDAHLWEQIEQQALAADLAEGEQE